MHYPDVWQYKAAGRGLAQTADVKRHTNEGTTHAVDAFDVLVHTPPGYLATSGCGHDPDTHDPGQTQFHAIQWYAQSPLEEQL